MTEVVLNFNELRCIQQYDNGGASEPYMWFVFFYADSSTIQSASGVVATRNMLSGLSCRNKFEENVKLGKTIAIPSDIGRSRLLLDDVGFPSPVVGVVYALLEENETTDSLMRTGHRVFGEAFNEEINNHVRNNLADPSLSDQQKKDMAKRIEDRVFSAVRNDAGVFEYFRTKDRVIGFHAEYFPWPVLSLISDRSNGNPYPLSQQIRKERVVIVNMRPVTVVDEYEVNGSIQVRPYTPPAPDRCQAERNALNAATQRVKSLQSTLRALQTEFAQTPGPQRAAIRAQIIETRAELSQAIDAAEQAQEAYTRCRSLNLIRPGVFTF